jgi:hypothetical protein
MTTAMTMPKMADIGNAFPELGIGVPGRGLDDIGCEGVVNKSEGASWFIDFMLEVGDGGLREIVDRPVVVQLLLPNAAFGTVVVVGKGTAIVVTKVRVTVVNDDSPPTFEVEFVQLSNCTPFEPPLQGLWLGPHMLAMNLQ